MKLEVCASRLETVTLASKMGFNSVELCSHLEAGGSTPSFGLIAKARDLCRAELHVLIRPEGRFSCSEQQLECMLHDIGQCLKLGVDGVVFGTIKPDLKIDRSSTLVLKRGAGNMKTSFHRAFDLCADYKGNLEWLTTAGFHRILTSGLAVTAYDGREILKELQDLAGDAIEIIVGGKVNEFNIPYLSNTYGLKSFHLSGERQVCTDLTSDMEKLFGLDEEWETYHEKMVAVGRVKESFL